MMKDPIRTMNAPIMARLIIPGSKSMTHRALLLAVLAEGVSEISNFLVSNDTDTFVNALRDLGVMIQLDKTNSVCIVGGGGGELPRKEGHVCCHHSVSVALFLLVATAISPGTYHFQGEEKNDMSALLNALQSLGIKIHPKNAAHLPLTITGTNSLKGGEFEINAPESGLFISALLMIAPFARKPLLIKTNDDFNEPEIEMTCEMMAEFNVLVRRMHQGRYFVPIPQRYHPKDYLIEPDFSIASYFFAAATITSGQVTIQPVDRKKSKQSNAEFLDVLEKMGCQLIESKSGLTVTGPKELKGTSVDMRRFPDTWMALIAIAPFAKTPTTMTNIHHTLPDGLREELKKLKIHIEEGKDWLKVHPGLPQPGIIDTHDDYRIAIIFSIMRLRLPDIQIQGMDCLGEICPNFFELWGALV